MSATQRQGLWARPEAGDGVGGQSVCRWGGVEDEDLRIDRVEMEERLEANNMPIRAGRAALHASATTHHPMLELDSRIPHVTYSTSVSLPTSSSSEDSPLRGRGGVSE